MTETSQRQKTHVKPSRWFYVLAVVVFAGGCGLFLWFLISGILDLSSGMMRMVVPGEHELELKEAGDYTVFHEYYSVMGDRVYSMKQGGLPGIECQLTSKTTGEKIRLAPTSMHATYSMGSHSGVSVLKFSIDSPGTYVFTARYPESKSGPDTVMAVSKGFVMKLVVTVLGSIAIMFAAFLGGGAIAVVTFVKRQKGRE